MYIKAALLSLLFASTVLAACNPTPATNTPQVAATMTKPLVATSEPDATSEATPAVIRATTTYIDKRSGIAFDYPNGWSIIEPSADDAVIYTYSLASYDLTNPSAPSQGSESGVPGGETKIDISFYSADETPDSARRTVQADVDSGMAIVTKEETRTNADGSTAYYYEIAGRLGGNARVIYTSVKGHTVGVVAYGDGTYFEQIAKSLRMP